MPVEDIIAEIRREEKIINEAQKRKEVLYDKLLKSSDDDFDFVSVKEAARLLDVSLGTIYNQINSGKIRVEKIGSVMRIRKSELVG